MHIDTLTFALVNMVKMGRVLKTGIYLCASYPQEHPVAEYLSLFREIGAEITKREGSRIGAWLFGDQRIFQRPHPLPSTDKRAITFIRKWLKENQPVHCLLVDVKANVVDCAHEKLRGVYDFGCRCRYNGLP